MRVLFLKDVSGVARAGDVKVVTGGYAKNYLLPRGLAVAATEGTLKKAESIKEAAEEKRGRSATHAQALSERLEGHTLVFSVRAGEGDRMYGSITNTDVADALAKSMGIEIDRRHVDLEQPIKTLGEHPVLVRLGSGHNATVRVFVERAQES